MEKYNFIVLAPNKWNSIWMNRQHLFSIIGKDHNVVYSNGPLYYWDRSLPRFKESNWFTGITEQDNISLVEFPKLLLRVPKLKTWDKLVKQHFCQLLNKRIDPNLPTILYIFNPLFHEYIDLIPHDLLVYHPYDDFTKLYASSGDKDGNRILAERSDLIITTSNLLKKNYQEISDNVHFVPNGVDFSLFQNWDHPVEQINKDRFKVGYTGSLNSKIDLSLLVKVFSALPEVDFYVIGGIGRVDNHQKQDLEKLKALDNCYFLGNKPLKQVPSYMRAMDINIIPYRTDPDSFANAGYPLKLHEYLSVGKPIICSPIDSAFEFSDVMHIKGGEEEWITTIQYIQNSQEEYSVENEALRNSIARENTWQVRVNSIQNIIENDNSKISLQ